MTLEQLVVARAIAYKFRVRGSRESIEDYRAALIPFLEQRDFASAHEVRVGRPQAEWTEDDVTTFHMFLEAQPGPREELAANELALVPLTPAGFFGPATNTTLLEMAQRSLNAVASQRSANPRKDLPILLALLMVDGATVLSPVPRGDRVAIVRALVRQLPVFGFVVVADVLIHGAQLPDGTVAAAATKRDALLAHVGSRDLRVMMARPYVIAEAERVVWHTPFEQDLRASGVDVQDPYAHVFVSVPPAGGVQ